MVLVIGFAAVVFVVVVVVVAVTVGKFSKIHLMKEGARSSA